MEHSQKFPCPLKHNFHPFTDSSYGLLLKGNGNVNFNTVAIGKSGFFVKVAVRDIKIIKRGKQNLLLIAKNNDSMQVFHRN